MTMTIDSNHDKPVLVLGGTGKTGRRVARGSASASGADRLPLRGAAVRLGEPGDLETRAA